MPVLSDAELRAQASELLNRGKERLKARVEDAATQKLWGEKTAAAADVWAERTEPTVSEILGATAEARAQGLQSWAVVEHIGRRLGEKRPAAATRGAAPPTPPARK